MELNTVAGISSSLSSLFFVFTLHSSPFSSPSFLLRGGSKLLGYLGKILRTCHQNYLDTCFEQEVKELATKILRGLQSVGRPFIAYELGMIREALAYYGCAELFQDVHTELIQHKRPWMLKRAIVKGKLSLDSAQQG